MNKQKPKMRLLFGRIPEETAAIILVVVFLLGLVFYTLGGIKGYDDQERRFMVTTKYERTHETAENPITPSVDLRVEYTLRDYGRTMAFIIGLFLALSLWNQRQEAHLQAYLCAIFMLLGIGCSQKVLYEGFYGLTGEAGFIVIGCLCMIGCFFLWRAMGLRLNKTAYVLLSLLICVMLTLNLWAIFRGEETNGAYNWVNVLGIRLQPSEFIKAGLILLGSCSFQKTARKIWYFLLLIVSCGVILLAKDIGALFVLALLFVSMVYLIFDDKRLLTLILCLGAVAFVLMIYTSSTASQRMRDWGHAMTNTAQHQQLDFISAVVRGGWRGLGIKNAPEFFFLYAGGTDGVLAGVQCIFGLPMLLIVMGCYITLIMQCGANRSLYPSSQPILFQMAVFITAQVLLNYGGALDILPFTGITAPLLSTGGSSLLTNMCLFGVMGASLYSKFDIDKDKEVASYEK